MHKYTLVHVAKPGRRSNNDMSFFRIEKVKANSAAAAIAPYCGARMTVAEINATKSRF